MQHSSLLGKRSVAARRKAISNIPPARPWNATTNQFPDQNRPDQLVEIEAGVTGHDQGYLGWTLLPDERLFVVNSTDDTAQFVQPGAGGGNARMGISWIREFWLDLADLPPHDTMPAHPERGP